MGKSKLQICVRYIKIIIFIYWAILFHRIDTWPLFSSYLSESCAEENTENGEIIRNFANSSLMKFEEFENNSNVKSDNQHILELLQTLVELQKKSTKLESAIKLQGREIKMDILPDGYDKRMAPPRTNCE